MIIKCNYCKKKFNKSPYYIARSKQNFCSMRCAGMAKRKSKIKVKCFICHKIFYKIPSEKRSDKCFCSKKCFNKWLSTIKLNSKNPAWKGNKVKYAALHNWVRKRLPKPKLCEYCKKIPPYDLANKGIYNRDLKNWEWLCRSCHMNKDGRINNLLRGTSKYVKRNKKGMFYTI